MQRHAAQATYLLGFNTISLKAEMHGKQDNLSFAGQVSVFSLRFE